MKQIRSVFPLLLVSLVISGCTFNHSSSSISSNSSYSEESEEISISFESSISEEVNNMYIYINNHKLSIALENNSSVEALSEILKLNDISFVADDYGDFEKVGRINYNLPRNDTHFTAVPGDIILYQGNSISLMYGVNTWSYTLIGKIDGYEESEMRSILGAGQGELETTLSIN